MVKSGAKLIGVAVVLMAVGIVCAYQVDQSKGTALTIMVYAALILCLGGAAAFLLGLYKLVVGLVKRS